jgi:hypothetical protein
VVLDVDEYSIEESGGVFDGGNPTMWAEHVIIGFSLR